MLKINLGFNQKLFITSDTHYNHKNICRGVTEWRTEDGQIPIEQTRPFKTLDHMNDVIVNNINHMVREDDILIHLGDWSFGGFESIKEFRDRIHCKNIYLTYGNHDHHIENNREGIQGIFTKTMNYTTLRIKKEPYKLLAGWEHDFVLMHYPLASWHDMNKGRFHLFGHVHLPEHKKVMDGRSMDVGMDGNNLYPYDIVEVIRKLSVRPVQANKLPSDHHEERLKNSK